MSEHSDLKKKVLPTIQFPSGHQYFDKNKRLNVVVVHNNYIIGHDAKVSRFKKHSLWKEYRADASKKCEKKIVNPNSVAFGTAPWKDTNLKEEYSIFLHKFATKNNAGGMRLPHQFAIYTILNALKPETVIESGVYKAVTTRLIRKILPDSKIISLDVKCHNNKKALEKKTGTEYLCGSNFRDFSKLGFKWANIKKETALVIFDDHQSGYDRLIQAHNFGFEHMVFEDNHPFGTDDNYSLKQLWMEYHAGVRKKNNFGTIDEPLSESEHCMNRKRADKIIGVYAEFPPLNRENSMSFFRTYGWNNQGCLKKKKCSNPYKNKPKSSTDNLFTNHEVGIQTKKGADENMYHFISYVRAKTDELLSETPAPSPNSVEKAASTIVLTKVGHDGMGHMLLGAFSLQLYARLDENVKLVKRNDKKTPNCRGSKLCKAFYLRTEQHLPKRTLLDNPQKKDHAWPELSSWCEPGKASETRMRRCKDERKRLAREWSHMLDSFRIEHKLIKKKVGTAVHIRKGDAVWGPNVNSPSWIRKTIRKFFSNNNIDVFMQYRGDADEYVSVLDDPIQHVGGDTFHTWLHFVDAKILYVSATSFTLSAAIFRNLTTVSNSALVHRGRYDWNVKKCKIDDLWYQNGYGNDDDCRLEMTTGVLNVKTRPTDELLSETPAPSPNSVDVCLSELNPMGRTANHMVSILHATPAKGTLGLGEYWSNFYTKWFDIQENVKLYFDGECKSTVTPVDAFYSAKSKFRFNKKDWPKSIVLKKAYRDEAKRILASYDGPVATVHGRWLENTCITRANALNNFCVHKKENWKNTCHYTSQRVSKLMPANIKHLLYISDGQKAEYAKTFLHVDKHSFNIQFALMIESDYHFGNPMSSIDYAVSKMRQHKPTYPEKCFAEDMVRTERTETESVRKNEEIFKIHVLTMNRPKSLQRLLKSIEKTDYENDRVELHIHIDKSTDNDVCIKVAKSFQFSRGKVDFDISEQNNGLRNAWFRAWRPQDNERAIILEDDIELSVQWYKWLKRAWEATGDRDDLAGISLQRQTLVPRKPHKHMEIVNNHKPFLYSLVGSIGFSPHWKQWRAFLNWIDSVDTATVDVKTPGLITSDWMDKLDRRHMWTQYFIWFCNKYDLYTLYINLPAQKTLAAHMREKGEHYGQTEGRDFALATEFEMNFPLALVKYGWDGRMVVRTDAPPRTSPVLVTDGSEYGGWTYDSSQLTSDSVVYSVGLGEDTSWDEGIMKRFGLNVWGFDPTPKSIEYVRKNNKLGQNFHFTAEALGIEKGLRTFTKPKNPHHVSMREGRHDGLGETVEVHTNTLQNWMDKFGHSHIDILKIDIEGSEYDVLEDWIKKEWFPMDQLLVEFHQRFFENTDRHFKVIAGLKESGFKIIHDKNNNGQEIAFRKLQKRASDFVQQAKMIQSLHGFVNIQLLNTGYVDMTKSWICNVRSFPGVLEKTLFITTDQIAHDKLLQFDSSLNVVLELYETPKDLTYGQYAYYDFMLFRTRLLIRLLKEKITVWLTESDAVWLNDPTDIVLNTHGDMVTMSDGKPPAKILQGGFQLLRPTNPTVSVWTKLLAMFQRKMSATKKGTNMNDSGSEQLMLNGLIRKEPNLDMQWLDWHYFAPGLYYRSHQKWVRPYVILNNWIKGNKAKIARAKKWKHWFLDGNGQCLT